MPTHPQDALSARNEAIALPDSHSFARRTASKSLAAMFLLGCAPAALAQDMGGPSPMPDRESADQASDATAIDSLDRTDADANAGPFDGNEIIVTATKPRGSVISDVPPLETLSSEDISSYGAGSLQDLVAALAPQTGSARGRGSGRPAILLNGQRISGFREIRDLPPEAIERVEIFPEELALQYGYQPDQRVINFILKPNFSSITGEFEHALSTGGGFGVTEAQTTYTKIGEGSRLVVDLEYEGQTKLRESERGIAQENSANGYSLGGNVASSPYNMGTEIDPALTAVLGAPVSLAGIPVLAAGQTPMLNDFSATPNATDLGAFRTLLPSSDRYSANVTYSRTLGGTTNFQVNSNYDRTKTEALQGLNTALLTVPSDNPFSPFSNAVSVLRAFAAPGAIRRTIDTETLQASTSINGRLAGWNWTITGDASRVETQTLTDQNADFSAIQDGIAAGTINPFATGLGDLLVPVGRNEARSVAQIFTGSATAFGTLVELPAGSASLTLNGDFVRRTLDTSSSTSAALGPTNLGRTEGAVSANLEIPLVDRYATSWLGELSVNGNLGYRDVSDFGGLTSFNFGLNWSPFDGVNILASAFGEEAAPTIQQLGNPTIVTPNVTVYDFSRGESVLATITSGGNAGLASERRRDIKLSLNYEPKFLDGLRFIADFVSNRSFNTTASFPTLTPEIEAAFPGRVTRDANGQLIAIDQRPVNFAQVSSDRLRYGLDFSKRFGPERTEGGQGGAGRRGRPGAGAQRGGAPGRFGGPGGGRWNVSIFHTIRFAETILIAPGIPELDLLGGSATGSNGGAARHSVEMEGGWFKDGIGFRVSGNFESGSNVNGGTAPGASNLTFGDIATINLRAFVDLERRKAITRAIPFFKGSRISVRVDNVFDAQQRVTDDNGMVPLSYQPGFLDPRGRVVELELRKRF